MDFRPSKLKFLALLPFLGGGTVFHAAGQGAPPLDQPPSIIFSTPQNDDATGSSSPQPPLPPNFTGTLQPAAPAFNLNPPGSLPPSPRPAVSSTGQQRVQKILEDRKNWTLLTPEEILGTATPEKILGVVERDADGREKNLTPTERFLERQNLAQGTATNGYWAADPPGRRDFSSFGGSLSDGAGLNPEAERPGNTSKILARFLDGGPAQMSPAGQNGSAFRPGFSPASMSPATPNPAQLAAQERFRQLLEPTREAAPAAKHFSHDGNFSLPQTLVDPNLTVQPVVNPLGASFTPLSSGILRPAGLTPLPGLITPRSAPPAAPSWAPQPAPWLQPFAVPQRKF